MRAVGEYRMTGWGSGTGMYTRPHLRKAAVKHPQERCEPSAADLLIFQEKQKIYFIVKSPNF